jgi:hypothetical protein
MNKIIEKLLTVTFPTVDVNSLLEVVTATPNPTIATEILCGLYEEPILPKLVQETSGDKRELTFKSYNKWDDKVHYSYIKEKTINGYFPKGTVREEITLENFKEREVSWKSGMDQVSFSLKTGETSVDTSYCSSSNWLGYTNLDYQFTEMLAQQMLDNPENYGLI